MNKLLIAFTGVLCIFMATGCSTKFNVAAPYKNVTVVYGYLDPSDTAHYIRIQKAYLSQGGNALTMAKDPDSNYYASLNVQMKLLNISDSSLAGLIQLNRVDLTAEGYPKQPGQFFQAPNYAYKFKNVLNPNYLYRLIITNTATNQVDSVTSPVIDTDYEFGVPIFTTSQLQMGFASTLPGQNFEMTGSYSPNNPSFSFEGFNSPAYYGQTIVRFNWVDSNAVSHERVPHYYDYNAGYFLVQGGSFGASGTINIPDNALYGALASALDPAPTATYRLLDRAEIFIYLSTYDFYTYQQSTLNQGIGLTGTEIEPVYTNVKGAATVGLFTARAMRSGLVTISSQTIDSLMVSPLLSSANIVGTDY